MKQYKNTWNVMRLKGGSARRNAANFIGPEHDGEPYDVPFWFFAIWNDEHKIIVDTTAGDEERLWYTDVPNVIPEEEKLPVQIKSALGWDMEDVDTVINTHLHWDHTGYNKDFPNAVFCVRREEYEYGINYGMQPGFSFFYKLDHFDKTAVPYHRWHFVDGEEELFPGLMLIPASGHGKAPQMVLVCTEEGEACITGDVVNTMYSIENDYVTAAVMDPEGQIETYEKIRQIADFCLTSHDLAYEQCYDHQTGNWPVL